MDKCLNFTSQIYTQIMNLLQPLLQEHLYGSTELMHSALLSHLKHVKMMCNKWLGLQLELGAANVASDQVNGCRQVNKD